jgi:hypothetical protein
MITPRNCLAFGITSMRAKDIVPEPGDPRVKKNFKKNKNKFGGMVLHLYLCTLNQMT